MEANNVIPTGSVLSKPHQVLLQSFFFRQIMPDDAVQTLYRKIATKFSVGNIAFEDFISTINDQLHFVFLEIRKVVSEEDGRSYWGFVNARSDTHAQLATSYTAPEISFFKKVLEAILTVTEAGLPVGEIGTTDAVNLARGIDGLTLSNAQQTLKRLVQDHWLTLSGGENKKVLVGVRSLLELRPFLEDLCGETNQECVLCSELVIRGLPCPNKKCATKMHNHCAKKWFTGKEIQKCPTCTTPWKL